MPERDRRHPHNCRHSTRLTNSPPLRPRTLLLHANPQPEPFRPLNPPSPMSRRSGLTVDADASEDTSGFLASPVSSGAGGGQTPDGRERVASDYSDGTYGPVLRRPSSTDRGAPPTPTSSSAASSAAASSKNQSAVKVGIRVRPLNERELKLGDKGDAWEISENTLQVRRREARRRRRVRGGTEGEGEGRPG